ncbi:MSMEG_0570 family nitrogen starvation response protein [Sorangium sp. So ce1335]|uniref:MSMEG_0570 family nitrogen starvation response protein n=1 Tax=Sorangium sp. So ce1335 TaxID=3133335 RepID=UPI003F63682B
MPEMRFVVEWPSGEQQVCYSPSLVVKEHIEVGESYDVDDFVARCRKALDIASERVLKKYGFPCSLARAEAARIAAAAARFRGQSGVKVRVVRFVE